MAASQLLPCWLWLRPLDNLSKPVLWNECGADQRGLGSAVALQCEWLSWASGRRRMLVLESFFFFFFDLTHAFKSVVGSFGLSLLHFVSAYCLISIPCIQSLLSLISILFILLIPSFCCRPPPPPPPLPASIRPLIPCHVGLKMLVQALLVRDLCGRYTKYTDLQAAAEDWNKPLMPT